MNIYYEFTGQLSSKGQKIKLIKPSKLKNNNNITVMEKDLTNYLLKLLFPHIHFSITYKLNIFKCSLSSHLNIISHLLHNGKIHIIYHEFSAKILSAKVNFKCICCGNNCFI